MMPGNDLVALVVEDEWLLRLEIADEMRLDGWHVLEAASGEAALDQLKAAPQIDLLITDIRLTGTVDGWDVAEAFRVHYPKLPTIYVSANPVDSARVVAGALFFAKPCVMQELLGACRRLVCLG